MILQASWNNTTPWGTNLDQFLEYEKIQVICISLTCTVLFFLQLIVFVRAIKQNVRLIALITGMLMFSQICLITEQVLLYRLNLARFEPPLGQKILL